TVGQPIMSSCGAASVLRISSLCERLRKIPAPPPQPTPEPAADEVRHSIRCTVRLPDPEKDDPGHIIEGSYSLAGNVLRVYDETGRLLAMDTLRPDDDAAHAARKILKEKHVSGFTIRSLTDGRLSSSCGNDTEGVACRAA